MKKFKIGDIVTISRNIAGMKEGEVGMVTNFLEGHGMVVIRLSETLRYYNMLPEDLELSTDSPA